MTLRSDLLDVVLADLPETDSVLGEPSPRWDELLGGRLGANDWARYCRGFGTTCIIVANGWALDAGLPEDMLITVPTPTGGGTKILRAMLNGAKSRGWLRSPTRGEVPDLQPGDIYMINRATKDGSDGTHMGVVVRVTEVDGGLEVETADGGQGTRQKQCAKRNVRKISLGTDAHAVDVKSEGGVGWLERWIRVGGDETSDETSDAQQDTDERPFINADIIKELTSGCVAGSRRERGRP